MFQAVESSIQQVQGAFARSGQASALGDTVLSEPSEPSELVETLLRGGLEIASIRRVDAAYQVQVRILTRRGRLSVPDGRAQAHPECICHPPFGALERLGFRSSIGASRTGIQNVPARPPCRAHRQRRHPFDFHRQKEVARR